MALKYGPKFKIKVLIWGKWVCNMYNHYSDCVFSLETDVPEKIQILQKSLYMCKILLSKYLY